MPSIVLSGFEEFQGKLKGLPALMQREVGAEIQDASRRWESRAKQAAPVDQGRLRNSITSRKTGVMSAEVTVNSEDAPWLEWGTKTKVRVPSELQAYASQFRGKGSGRDAKKMIYEWCKRNGIPEEAWYPIYRSIMRFGINPHPFFFIQLPLIQVELRKNIPNILNTLH